MALSSVYVTEPQGLTEQPHFYNMVVEVETGLTPHGLLDRLSDIECALGRVRTVRYGPRTIDLDLLLYGDEVLSDERLIVPHPRMGERAFVLVPLLEIYPGALDPRTGRAFAEHLHALHTQGVERAENGVQAAVKQHISVRQN